MSIFNRKKNNGLTNVIRCDETDYLIWKWHPTNDSEGKRSNEIRMGSSLRVKDGSVAVFVYKQNDAVYQDYITGPFDTILETNNFPVISNILGWAYGGSSPFQAEIYFVNLAKIIQTRFAVPYFEVFDPRFPDFGVPVAVRGTISFQIKDYKNFIKLHRLDSFSVESFGKQITDAVTRHVKDAVSNAPAQNNIPVMQIETKISLINDVVEYSLATRLEENFGVSVSSVDIAHIDIDKSSNSYLQLERLTKDITTAKVQADATDYIEKMQIQREESQYALHKQTQTANINAFQIESQAAIGIAGAEALGKMSANGSGAVNLGEAAPSGFNPSAVMTSMALGNAVGQTLANTLNTSLMGSTNTKEAVAPPVSAINYNVAINGQSTGPYDISSLKLMAQAGQLTTSTLVWKPGMPNWEPLSAINELIPIISCIPPEIK